MAILSFHTFSIRKDKWNRKKIIKILTAALEYYASPDVDETGSTIVKDGIVARKALKEIRNINGNSN